MGIYPHPIKVRMSNNPLNWHKYIMNKNLLFIAGLNKILHCEYLKYRDFFASTSHNKDGQPWMLRIRRERVLDRDWEWVLSVSVLRLETSVLKAKVSVSMFETTKQISQYQYSSLRSNMRLKWKSLSHGLKKNESWYFFNCFV